MILTLVRILFWTEIFVFRGIFVLSESIQCTDSYTGEIINVTLNATIENYRYVLNIGNTYKVGIMFTPGQDFDDCDLDFKTEIVRLPPSLPLLSFSFLGLGFTSNCCENHNIICPLESDKIHNYTTNLQIQPKFPPMSFVIKIVIQSLGKKTPIACQTMNITIKA